MIKKTGKTMIGLNSPSSYYLQLVTEFPPRPITNEAELLATHERIEFLLDKGQINQEEKDYIKVLATLAYDYEEKYETIPQLSQDELLQALLEELNFQSSDLISVLGDETIVLDILEGKRDIPDNKIIELADFLNVSPSLLSQNHTDSIY